MAPSNPSPSPATCLAELPQPLAPVDSLHLLTLFGVVQWDLKWSRQLQEIYMFPSNIGHRKLQKCFLDCQF